MPPDLDLLPCPFCGSENLHFQGAGWLGNSAYVSCGDCSTDGPFFDMDADTEEAETRADTAAVAAWNRRVPVPPTSTTTTDTDMTDTKTYSFEEIMGLVETSTNLTFDQKHAIKRYFDAGLQAAFNAATGKWTGATLIEGRELDLWEIEYNRLMEIILNPTPLGYDA